MSKEDNILEFIESYKETLILADLEEDNPDACEFSDSANTAIEKDCRDFIKKAGRLLELEERAKEAGHDFYLTRVGHGAGFWDGDWSENGDKLTEICDSKRFQWANYYVGDDGLIHT